MKTKRFSMIRWVLFIFVVFSETGSRSTYAAKEGSRNATNVSSSLSSSSSSSSSWLSADLASKSANTFGNSFLMDEIQDLYKNLRQVYETVRIVREIYLKLGTLITVCGLVLNLLCIVVFFKSKLFHNSSFPYYVCVISVVDILNILMRFAIPQTIENGIRARLHAEFNLSWSEMDTERYQVYTSRLTSPSHCGIMMYVHNSLTLASVWLMAAVSLERWLVIKFALQSKRVLKCRAVLTLMLVIVCVFSLNIFDLAPTFYIKPTWFANLTLFCERDDTSKEIFLNNSMSNTLPSYHKTIWRLTFNTNTFVLIRMLLQTVAPFLIVLVFNSLIIYNFKRIKSAALGRAKSNSFVSMNSCSALDQNLSVNSAALRARRRRNTTHVLANTNRSLLIGSKSPTPTHSSISRSPSPFRTLVSKQQQQFDSISKNKNNKNNNNASSSSSSRNNATASPAPTTSTTATTHLDNLSARQNLPNDFVDSINQQAKANSKTQNFLMPPTFSLQKPEHTNVYNNHNNNYCNNSINNEDDETNINNNNNSSNCNSDSCANSMIASSHSKANEQASDTFSFTIIPPPPPPPPLQLLNSQDEKCVRTKISTQTQTTNRVSFKNKKKKKKMKKKSKCIVSSSRNRLNHETDIMLIVLSFSILISQLPCTVLWYLIYYMNILTQGGFSIFSTSYMPAFLLIIRLLEMIYFSLNFIFYITLSPSLRKEIWSYLCDLFRRNYNINNSNNNNISNSSNRKHTLNNTNNHESNSAHLARRDASKKRLYSNDLSGADCIDYVDRLGRVSPLHRPTVFNSAHDANTKTKTCRSECECESDVTVSNKTERRQRRVSTKNKTKLTSSVSNFLSSLRSYFKLKSKDSKTDSQSNGSASRSCKNAHVPNCSPSITAAPKHIRIVINSLYSEHEQQQDEEEEEDRNYKDLLRSGKKQKNEDKPNVLR